MRIYLIRHTQPDVELGICYGTSDLGLVETFQEEAQAIKNILPDLNHKTKILSSPLQRCHQLANFLAPEHPIEIDNRLIEISFGDWEMKPWRSIGKETLITWKDNFVHIPSPNGEPFLSVFQRAKHLYEELQQQDYEQVFLVSHSGVIRAFLCHLTGIPLENAFNEQFGYGVVFEINEKGKVYRVK